MVDTEAWKKKARKSLGEEIVRKRKRGSTIEKVDALFEEVKAARLRGMAWDAIAQALADEKPVTADAAASAFERICRELGQPVWGRRLPPQRNAGAAEPGTSGAATVKQPPSTVSPCPEEATLFSSPTRYGREVDDGD